MVAINVEYSTEINASAERIWDILADVGAWPEWQGTPFVRLKTPAPIKQNSVFEVKLMGFKGKITVTKAERPEKFAWIGKSLGIIGNHEWEFKEHEEKTLATTRERISGWTLVPLYFSIRNKALRFHEKWLADLKARAESL
jgi:uncharacterized protein YndB with AHSA1/START domain